MRSVERSAIAWLLVCAVQVAAAPARAQQSTPESAAADFFRAGAAATARGDFKAAARAFEEAHRRVPRAAATYNAALAWQAANDPARAANAFDAALAEGGLTPEQIAESKRRLAALEPSLGRLRVIANPRITISVAHVDARPAPFVVRLASGDYEVRARYPDGSQRIASQRVRVGDEASVTFPDPPPVAPPPTPAGDTAPPRSSSSSRTTWRVAGIVGVGSAVAVAGVATVFGVRTLSARDDYDRAGHTDEHRDLYDRAVSLRTTTNVLVGVSAGLAAIGAAAIVVSFGRTSTEIRANASSISSVVSF